MGRVAAHIESMIDVSPPRTPEARLQRQFARIGRRFPAAGGFLAWLRKPGMHLVRLPLGLVLIVGGLLGFLPILGFWMLPLGLVILALDIPVLRRPVGNALVRLQRWIRSKRRPKAR